MTGRAVAGAATAAVLLACAPAAVAAPAAGSAAVAVAKPAPTHVALLVKYPDASVRTWCVPYTAGMSGAAVLAPAQPTYGSGPYAGFVLKIGGQGTVPPTDTTYWAYWRSPTGTGSGYAYSSAGVTSTRPAAGSVEAWVWNRSSSTTFPHRSFATVCPSG